MVKDAKKLASRVFFLLPSHEQWPPIIYLLSPLLSALFPAVLLSFLRVVGSTCTEGAWSFLSSPQLGGPSPNSPHFEISTVGLL
ncbi:unnamed protein product [Lathyrus oleraceus]